MMQSLVKFKSKKKGFTLVELIVVIAIIGILAAILMPKFFGFTDDARKSAAITEAKNIRTLAETYYAKYGSWAKVSKAKDFEVQTGGAPSETPVYTNSPTFSGTIDPGGADQVITDGTFTYTVTSGTNTFEINCDANGVVTDITHS